MKPAFKISSQHTTSKRNKKLRYCEQRSASVVLSCIVYFMIFMGENLLMANQPLLRNWLRKLPN